MSHLLLYCCEHIISTLVIVSFLIGLGIQILIMSVVFNIVGSAKP